MPAYCKKNGAVIGTHVHRFSENVEAVMHALEMRKLIASNMSEEKLRCYCNMPAHLANQNLIRTMASSLAIPLPTRGNLHISLTKLQNEQSDFTHQRS